MSLTLSNLQRRWLGAAITSIVLMAVFALLGDGFKLWFFFAETVLISIVIAQACDPFADAAQWVGDEAKLPGSVRGATLDAIASSMPELFSGIFFVLVAISASESAEARVAAGAEGYGATIATCAGSAVYNMILIPAFCALFISFYRKSRPTIDVDDEVISRDGVWFVTTQGLLVLFLFQDAMTWWMGVCFLVLYGVYIWQLYNDTLIYRRRIAAVAAGREALGEAASATELRDYIRQQGIKVTVDWLERLAAEEEADEEQEDEDEDNSTGVLFGVFEVGINARTAPIILLVSTLVAAGACYFLVEATRGTAEQLGVPTFFVAVIIAAAASSLPDTLLSIGAAMRGDDSGAVSNAFGSNIFDICVCTSIPLIVNSYLTGWQPVSLMSDGEPIPGLVNLRILLIVLTIVTLAIMWHNRQLTRRKAYVLCALYAVFIMYAVGGSLNWF
ncbi:MAG: hypothetical protein KDB14_04765 [Planctomycetales bacterium]|nr:hypothetical protein [Planctomycetales bacterium]